MKPFIMTPSGKHYLGEKFTPDINEISFALSNSNRYNGHVGCYSVAEHSVRVAMQLPPELRLSGLLHDAHEAYYGDIVSPVKRLLGPKFNELCDAFDDVIDDTFGTDVRHPLVKEADLRMLVTEAQAFGLYGDGDGWPPVAPYGGANLFDTWAPTLADKKFMELFNDLRKLG